MGRSGFAQRSNSQVRHGGFGFRGSTQWRVCFLSTAGKRVMPRECGVGTPFARTSLAGHQPGPTPLLRGSGARPAPPRNTQASAGLRILSVPCPPFSAAPLARPRTPDSDRPRTPARISRRCDGPRPPRRTHPRIQVRGLTDFTHPQVPGRQLKPLAARRRTRAPGARLFQLGGRRDCTVGCADLFSVFRGSATTRAPAACRIAVIDRGPTLRESPSLESARRAVRAGRSRHGAAGISPSGSARLETAQSRSCSR
jgi:hypothetical protein